MDTLLEGKRTAMSCDKGIHVEVQILSVGSSSVSIE